METPPAPVRLGADTARVVALFRSRAHNFVGHHGIEPGVHPMEAVPWLDCVAGRGIVGDRFFDHRPDYKGQITFFEAEVHAAVLLLLLAAGGRTMPKDRCCLAAARGAKVTRGVVLGAASTA